MEAMPGGKRQLRKKRRPGEVRPETMRNDGRLPNEVQPETMRNDGRRPNEVRTETMRNDKRLPNEVRPETMRNDKRLPNETRPETMRNDERLPNEARPETMRNDGRLPNEARPGKMRPEDTSDTKRPPDAGSPGNIPDSARLAARLREETTELLALLPAARKAAAGGPAGGEAALDGIARAAYRVLRIAENMEACAALAAGTVKAVPICVTALAAAYVNGAAGVCRAAVFRPEWPREPLWAPGCARLFAAALGNLLANAVQYGGERPCVSVRAQKSGAMLLLTVADNGAGYTARPAACNAVHDAVRPAVHPAACPTVRVAACNAVYSAASPAAADGLGLAVVRQYAEAFGGQLLINSAPGQGARFTLCLPLCAPGGAKLSGTTALPGMTDPAGAARPTAGTNLPGIQEASPMQGAANVSGEQEIPFAPPIPPDYMADRFSPLYVQLAPVCDLPL